MDAASPSARSQSGEQPPVPALAIEDFHSHAEAVAIKGSERPPPSENDVMGKVQQHTSVDSASTSQNTPSLTLNEQQKTRYPNGRPWKTILFRLGPLSGIACLGLAIISILVSLGVLLGSNGVPVVQWIVQPSAVLAICTAVANQAMRYAAFQGLMIAWWSGALRGSTIQKLHNDWRSGMTIAGAISAGRGMGFLGLACIFSTLVAVDGPLLQKATRVAYEPINNEQVSLNISVLPELPPALYAGYLPANMTSVPSLRTAWMFNKTVPTGDNGTAPNNFRLEFAPMWIYKIQPSWLRQEPLSGGILGCPRESQCKLKVKAPAFAVTACSSHQVPVNWHQPASWRSVDGVTHATPLDRSGFFIDVTLVPTETKEVINLITGVADTRNCIGSLNYTACTLEAATGDYDVTVQDDTIISLDSRAPTILAVSNNTHHTWKWDSVNKFYNSTLAALAGIAQNKWGTSVFYATDPRLPPEVRVISYQTSNVPINFVEENNNDFDPSKPNPVTVCPQYRDPRNAIIEDMNMLMFYTGYMIGSKARGSFAEWLEAHLEPGLATESTVVGQISGSHNVYRTDLRWFGGAAAVELLCVALVLPTFIGWWRLGRPVSFSPIEIAKAFEAPLLADCNSNSSGRDIAQKIGGVRVQYGSTIDGHLRKRKLAFADPTNVQRPQQNSVFEM